MLEPKRQKNNRVRYKCDHFLAIALACFQILLVKYTYYYILYDAQTKERSCFAQGMHSAKGVRDIKRTSKQGTIARVLDSSE
jgi:hypothetical protein